MAGQHATTRRRADTRRRLIAAAYEVFSERSIRDTPVELICERAGFTRGAFYSNFGSKEELFLALFRDQTTARVRRFTAAIDTVLDGRELDLEAALTEVARVFMTALAEDRNWFLLVSEFRTQGLRRPGLRERIGQAQHEFHTALGDVLVAGLDRIGHTLTVPQGDAVFVLVALYEQALLDAALAGTDAPADRAVGELVARVLSSLITPS